ncbi:5-dehydro-2-deoxygluconokinase [Streptomyces sp. H27-C3]|uniref:5-dehydro-2-deoxygluconokinase n=1 Tax=Streptomyces sp. H27-C3 TaxID=3046305 RepID=UPI0024BBBEC4|nr:5-dehydro-2-deoxygluconokinase [Streptomyces sp. H27-C3]MDJ0463669.1 5-dehydro-2-deoxygluconokinase [Streptomyces sp. H27-C3]
MGRIGVDLYPLRAGVALAQVDTFGKFLGGSASNVAVAAARLGRRTAVITRTGQDPFGDYLHQELGRLGVDDRWVTGVADLPTPVTFCEIFPPDNFPLYFYRQPKAPDLEIHTDELDLDAIRTARIFWMTGTGLSAEPSRGATLAALAARGGDAGLRSAGAGADAQDAGRSGGDESRDGAPAGITVFDLDWRPMFWADPDAARPYYAEALRHATVAVGNLDECEVATGEREPHAAARALLAAGVELAVVKQGPKGVLAVHRDGTTAEVPPVPVQVLNGLGAGDAFGGALCHGLLAGWDLERTMRYANAAGAIVASRLACSSAMPYPGEVAEVLAGGEVPAQAPPVEAQGAEAAEGVEGEQGAGEAWAPVRPPQAATEPHAPVRPPHPARLRGREPQPPPPAPGVAP